MSTLNFDQIMTLWNNAGGDPGWAPLMAGIAMAESGGVTTVLNDNPSTGDYSVGLWQINYFAPAGLMGPRTAKYGSPQYLLGNPDAQAKAAVDLAGGGGNGLGPWRTDRAWDQWAAHGFPAKPSKATVQQWLQAAGVPTGGGPPGSTAATGGGTGPGGGSGVTGAGSGGQQPGADLSTCVIQMPGFLFFSGPCLLTKGGVKWLTGVASLTVGAGLFGFGVVMIAAWGLDASGTKGAFSGAKGAVTGAARKVGIGASLLTGQPEIAAGIAATGAGKGKGKGSSSSARTLGLGPSSRPSRPTSSSGEPKAAGIFESRRIERRFQAAQREQGPIGPRGSNPTSRRIAQGVSVPGPGRRPRTPERRRRDTETHEQRRARHRAEGFERVS